MNAMQIAGQVQKGAKTAGDSFNRFVEGDAHGPSQQSASREAEPKSPDADKVDFWESFGQEKHVPQHRRNTSSLNKKEENFWESFGEAPKGPPVEKQDFWDSFAAAGEVSMVQKDKQGPKAGGSIGTSAMKSGSGAGRKSDEWAGDW